LKGYDGMSDLVLADGFAFEDLYTVEGLARLDAAFFDALQADRPDLAKRLKTARLDAAFAASLDLERLKAEGKDLGALDEKEHSALLLELAPYLDDFLGRLFGIETELRAGATRQDALAPLFSVKRLFVQRRAGKQVKAEEAQEFDGDALASRLEELGAPPSDELACATQIAAWLDDEDAHGEALETARDYAAWALYSLAGRASHADGVLFKQPEKVDPHHLIPLEEKSADGVCAYVLPESELRRREGFALTDQGMDLTQALDHMNYCILCHHQGKDSCSRGLKDRDGTFRKTVFDVALAGCPLEEKISEMHEAKRAGLALGALAVAVIDNPMIAGTGHRICNDCMKACIYQKQDPVDIPQAETRILKDVLELPWGFEVYGLLTRWNPLKLRHRLARPDSGRKVLIAGLGPAGYTLAHFLLNDGHTVVAVDGLKIEPLDPELSGVAANGKRLAFRPIRTLDDLREPLDERIMAGFGGVAEYGITVRWDKTFLKVIRLLIERRERFAMYGGVRFGGTVTLEQAFEMGFDHVALAVGAGRPTVLPIPNGLARGVRAASDFLMALQLTGAAKKDSIANMQLRLPVVVIGGGLTAIDTATEALAYYPVQVEKFLARYDTLVAERGEDAVCAAWDEEERTIADEFLTHARAIRDERAAAEAEDREPRIRELLEGWGGVTIAYRKRLTDAPSYTLNHEEVAKAFEEGIRLVECMSPQAVDVDAYGHARAIRLNKLQHVRDGAGWITLDTIEILPARSVLVAAGTQPNTVLGREHPNEVALDGRYFQAVDEAGRPVSPERTAKPDAVRVLARVRDDGRAVSFWGDVHPSFAGNVVKAMASAKQGYPVVSRLLARHQPARDESAEDLFARLDDTWRATVHAVIRLTPTIVEVVARAPAAASAFHPGQFYRLQNYETRAPRVSGTTLAMEGLAMTGAWVDREEGLLSLIILEMGGSSDICALLQPGDPVVVMGPTGAPTEIGDGETVLLAGGGLGNAVLFSIGRAFREAGNRVLYFAGYKKLEDRYKVEEIEAAADVVVWACDEAPGFAADRPQDTSFTGTIVEAMVAYTEGALGEPTIALADVDRIITIGSQGMMAAVAQARHGLLRQHLKPGHKAIGSINSPMQCMMKEICAQCLQPHRDPRTGQEAVVFSCYNQDQPLDHVDFQALGARLRQNSVQEKLTAQWIDRCLKELKVRDAA
jgi:NADPH-dependent glutamate synthase beta subunit-like oxidoreductase/NAD(P)H-flavin reductase